MHWRTETRVCKFSGPDKLVSALAPKIYFYFFIFFLFSELVSARPTYIADEIRGPQSARSNRTDLYINMYDLPT